MSSISALGQDVSPFIVEIYGHTDSIGTKDYNQVLSELRAKVVGQYLASKGISPERLRPFGKGETQPVASNETEEGRFKNRRIELNIIEKK